MQLSVIIPVYNERDTIRAIIDRVDAVELDKEIIIVDDYSTDGTGDILTAIDKPQITVVSHNKNRGKGAALRTGLRAATGDFVIIQDADLEYDPVDYHKLIAVVDEENAGVVYGSRLTGTRPIMAVRHWVGNRLLTGLTNVLYGSSLTDMETCYKLIRRTVLEEIEIVSNRFNVEPEITAKLLKKGLTIYEVPISYTGRSFADGKKISWFDFVSAIWTLLKNRVSS